MSPAALDVALAARSANRKLGAGAFAPGAKARFPELVSAISARGAAFQEGLTEVCWRVICGGGVPGRLGPDSARVRGRERCWRTPRWSWLLWRVSDR